MAENSQVLEGLVSELQERKWELESLMAFLIAEAPKHGPANVLSSLLETLVDPQRFKALHPVDLTALGRDILNVRYFDVSDHSLPEALVRTAGLLNRYETAAAFAGISRIIRAMNFEACPVRIADHIANLFLLPFFERQPESSKDVEFFLRLEKVIDGIYLKKSESAEKVKKCYAAMTPALEECGELLKSPIQERSISNKDQRIAFLFFSSSTLAHADNFLTFLDGMAYLPEQPITPLAYIVGTEQAESGNSFPSAIRKAACDLRWIEDPAGEAVSLLRAIENQVEEDNVDVLVFVSAAASLITSAHMRVAPQVVWWAMKYHQIETGAIAGYLTYGSFATGRTIDGRPWRTCWPALKNLFDPEASQEAGRIRQGLSELGYSNVLTCIGREEKINHRPYLEALKRILDSNSDAVFLWTGRSVPADVKVMMEELDIAEKCQFIGWVNTKVMAQVTDIYADSFPFASGHTAYEAMAAGKPIVVLETPEALETSTATALLPVLKREVGDQKIQDDIIALFSENGADLAYCPFVETEQDYVERVSRLISDESFRQRCGEAGRAYVNQFISDTRRLAQDVSNHLLDIIDTPTP